MKINFLLFIIVIVFGFSAASYLDGLEKEQSFEKPAANFTLSTIGNEEISLKDFHGKNIFLHFWATWCAPCLIEFPEIIELAKKNNEVVFLTIAVEDSKLNIEKFLRKIDKETPNNFYIVLDSDWSVTRDLYGIRRLPETLIVRDTQTVSRHFAGAQRDWDKINLFQ